MRRSTDFLSGVVALSLLGGTTLARAQSAPVAPAAAAPGAVAPPPAQPSSPVPPATPIAAPAPSAPPAAPAGPPVTVLFDADDPDAVLETDWSAKGGTAPWYMLCSTPCEMRLSADAHYRAAGPGLYESPIFGLPPGHRNVTVHAEMQSKSITAGVLELIVGGTLFTIVGPLMIIAGADQHDHHRGGDGLVLGGATVGLAGAVLSVVGIVTLVSHGSNRESKVRLARAPFPELLLPAGLALDGSGLKF